MGGPMSIVAPKARKHLSADALFPLVRSGFATIPDARCDDGDIAFPDALMAAFALFALKASSLLAFDQERAEGNVHTIYGMERVPCDPHMRESLDPVSPKWLRPVCTSVCRHRQRGKAREEMMVLDGHYVLALDGTGSVSSQTMHCASCLHKVPRHGAITSYHQRLGAAIIHPDQRAVIPWMPDPIVTQDGTGTNDCERHAAKRFIATLRHDPPLSRASSPKTVCVPMLPTSRPCTSMGCIIFSGSKKAIMPISSPRGRQPSTLGASRIMSAMTALRGGASVSLCQRCAAQGLERGRAGQCYCVWGHRPCSDPALELGHRPAGEQAHGLSPDARWTCSVEDCT